MQRKAVWPLGPRREPVGVSDISAPQSQRDCFYDQGRISPGTGSFLRITGSPTGMTRDLVMVAISRHVCHFFGNSIFLPVGLPNTNVTVKIVRRYHQRETGSALTTGTSAVLRGGYSDNFVNMMVDIGASRNVIEDATSPGCGTDWNITRCWMYRENCPRPRGRVGWHCAGIAQGQSRKKNTDCGSWPELRVRSRLP